MINPQSDVRCVTVEGSKERAAGESVIDLAEYVRSSNGRQTVDYQQLKHSTVRVNQPLKPYELRRTLVAFAARYTECLGAKHDYRPGEVTFAIVTNRPVDQKLVRAAKAIARGMRPKKGASAELAGMLSSLEPSLLRGFCQALRFLDQQGDYRDQSRQLKAEIQSFAGDRVDDTTVNHVVALVQERVLPHQLNDRSKGEIRREDVLQRLGVSSDRDLFPAPPQFELARNLVRREQHAELEAAIVASRVPMIIHASGGVGKSVVAQQLVESLSRTGSLAVAYDCFGGGNYRNQANPRHRPCDALVQVSNELAARGLCPLLLSGASTPPDAIFRSFQTRIRIAVHNLRKSQANARLVILFDAADNAEMAAEEFGGERCFANAVMRLELPKGCHLVALCRTERIEKLKPANNTPLVSLRPFSEAETSIYLRSIFPQATENQVLQFHRLSFCNPRVQANALMEARAGLEAVLADLGPGGTTVEGQIQAQLTRAVARVKEPHGEIFGQQVDAICVGLANLPPNIPLEILAKASGADIAAIRSFVSDLRRPLWLSDSAVHFKDEPTETWFRDTFGADVAVIRQYVGVLEPLAANSTYVAQALPRLLHRAGEHDRLLALGLTDEFLPTSSPAEAREIRVYRLQYAFKAALKLRRMLDAERLAFRAGEEAAGDERQFHILGENLDLVFELHEPHRVEELAMRQSLRAAWDGSGNLFSASLLCRFREFRGDASAFLDSAQRWLQLFFASRDKEGQHPQFGEQLRDEHCAEFAWVTYHLDGPTKGVRSLLRWKPPEFVYRITRIFVRRLIDLGKITEVEQLAKLGSRNPHFAVAVAEQMVAIGLAPPREALVPTCRLLSGRKMPIERTQQHFGLRSISLAVIAFAEACAMRKLPKAQILRILSSYASRKASASVGDDYQSGQRELFARALCLRLVLTHRPIPEIKALLPKPTKDESRDHHEDRARRISEALRTLLPWQYLRARLLTGDLAALDVNPESVHASTHSEREIYGQMNRVAFEASRVWFEVLAFRPALSKSWLEHFTSNVLRRAERRFLLHDRLTALRTALRRPHLKKLCSPLEQSCREVIEQPSTDGPEEKASGYLSLARAVLPEVRADARAYFGEAIDIASKFGDEMVDRWRALSAVAKQSAGSSPAPSLSYRFLQVAETVGESVAREKHWERDDVFRVLVHLHPPSAVAGLSRWRDRRVGWFDEEIRAFTVEALNQNKITPGVAWSLTGFQGLNAFIDHAIECLRAETSPALRATMLRQAVRDMQLANASREDWERLQEFVKARNLDDSAIRTMLGAYAVIPRGERSRKGSRQKRSHFVTWRPAKWRAFFRGTEFHSVTGLAAAMDKFFSAPPPKDMEEFWSRFFARVPRGREKDCLEALITCEHADYFDITHLLRHAEARWMKYPSVSHAWKGFLRRLGRRHAVAVCSYQRMIYLSDQYGFTEEDLRCLKDGAVDGLRESPELVTAGTFFGFALHAAPLLTPTEAQQVLDFALGRFEKHIDPASGDGAWRNALQPPASMSESVAALVWCALASPYSSTRWQAAHVVRRFVAFGCVAEIAAMIGFYDKDSTAAFRAERFPFYTLHARLYLMIALARASREEAQALLPHREFFSRVALDSLPHVLLQHFAREIALALERSSPGTYAPEVLSRLGAVNRSPFPIAERTKKGKDEKTPWHASGELSQAPTVHFGIDFNEYWFDALGRVFGVNQQDVGRLVAIAAVKDLGIPSDGEFHPDPRGPQFERIDYYSRGTDHSHGSYPRNDNRHFYFSYHGLMIAAARLLKVVPVRFSEFSSERNEDPWDDWLDRHLAIRRDGNWVSDRRDPEPLIRRAWLREPDSDGWDWEIRAADFNAVIRDRVFMPGGLCVCGDWTESDREGGRDERFHVSSALVSSSNAEALARAFRESRDPRDFRLPEYDDEACGVRSPPFELRGWIIRGSSRDERMDARDPYAKQMLYPGFRLSPLIEQTLSLTADAEGREWRDNEGEVVVRSRIWAGVLRRSGENQPQTGRQLFASVAFLRRMCATLKMTLVLKVRIERDRPRDYRSRTSLKRPDIFPSVKVFLLRSHGNLREDRRSYRLG